MDHDDGDAIIVTPDQFDPNAKNAFLVLLIILMTQFSYLKCP